MWGDGRNVDRDRRLTLDLTAHRALVGAVLMSAAAVGALLYCRHYAQEAPGLSLYVEAARCMLDGAALQGCNPAYTYPPLVALATIPLVPLPILLQNLAWYALTLGSLAGCVLLSARLVRRLAADAWSERQMAWLYGVGILLSLKFIFAAIGNQSYDASVVLLVMGGLAFLAEERPGWTSVWAGASLGLAAALKATPLLFLPYLVVRRRYTAVAAMAVALAVACILPDLVFTVGHTSAAGSYFLAWLHEVAEPALSDKMGGNPMTFWWASNPNNYSLRGLVGLGISEASPHFTLVMYSVDAAYAAVVGLVILASRNGRAIAATDGALLLVSMLMLSPMTSQSHYVALVFPLFAVVAVWLKGDPAMRRAAGWVLIAVAILTNATSKDLAGAIVTQWAKEHRLLICAALLLVVFFVALALRSQSVRAAAGAASCVKRPAA
jgi:hypothetical protein